VAVGSRRLFNYANTDCLFLASFYDSFRECVALFQGHTSLVGQLQLTDTTLVTGGSDGKVIIFSLESYTMVHQLLAHDNSVTCLQFDDRFIVTAGNDGKVKLWNFKTGEFVRELCDQSDQIWKVSFRDDKW